MNALKDLNYQLVLAELELELLDTDEIVARNVLTKHIKLLKSMANQPVKPERKLRLIQGEKK